MPQQLLLFQAQEPTWAERLRQSLDADTHRQVVTLLAAMARAAVMSPAPAHREVPSDEN